jgi:putative Ca2+/H+ antiporter (TMEM165/GDT1 family)
MDFKTFLSTFVIIFLAELFDKTEVAIVSLSLKQNSKIAIFTAAMCAFFVATLLALLFSGVILRFLSPKVIRYISAFLFLLVGVLIFAGKI